MRFTVRDLTHANCHYFLTFLLFVVSTGYITVTSHYLEEWEMCNKVLATRKLEIKHTGVNIAEILRGIQRN